MSFKHFVHLHNHTDCSFLDGAIRIKDLVTAAAEAGMPAVAITDHGSLFGLVDFFREAGKKGIKPVLGYEAYVAVDSRHNRTYSKEARKYDHLILLARNEEGYRNLMKLGSIAYTEGFYFKPRIDKEALGSHCAGLIGLSACIQGEIPRALIQGDEARARTALEFYRNLFGPDHFYLELQNHGIDDEIAANERLISLARSTGTPLVATNDCHYLRPEDYEAHDALVCIQTGRQVADADRLRFSSDQLYFKSLDKMKELFGDVPDALENTVRVAEACNVNLGLHSKYFWPMAPKEEGFDDDDAFLDHISREGLKKRYPGVPEARMKELEARLSFELDVMRKMKVSGYMLIVWDFIREARKMNILVGPGRGSCVGSLVSYCIAITNVDPLKHSLLFERFLNPERVSMPDIDVDFTDRDRNKVIQYVIRRYGKDCVCQIATLGSMNAKGVLRDVARVLSIPLQEVNEICKLVPTGPNVKLDDSMNIPELKTAFSGTPLYQKWYKIAKTLEGLKRQPGVHAAGVIIAPNDVVRYSPLYTQKDTDMLVTQYDKDDVESIGLLKMDFLGLRNLAVIEDTLKQIKDDHGVEVDIDNLPMEDRKAFDLFSKGETVGVFQFESNGMQEYLRKLMPNTIEDIIAMNALYRPGPMENIPSYIHRKHGKEQINYYHPTLEPVLKETYGIIVYQEQVMQAAQVIGGFTLGKADILRRAMGKKKKEEMDKMKAEFLAGAHSRKIPEKLANEIYDLLAKFAEYGFNKSHAAAYSYIAYQTAWLKANYPEEFMAANMTSELSDTDRVFILMTECKRMDISVLPPDINKSGIQFRALEKGRIMFGLGAIKGVGVGCLETILAERDKNGPFKSLFDFCGRVDLRTVNKRVLEALVCSGALDTVKGNRAQLFAAIERAAEYGVQAQHDRETGQTSLFGGGGASSSMASVEPELPDVEPWLYSEVLKKEKETLGFYVSGHPLKDFEDEITGFATVRMNPESCKQFAHGAKVVVGGIIVSIRRLMDKRGRQMAFVQMEDFDGTCEVLVFSSVYEQVAPHLSEDNIIFVSGTLDKTNENSPKIMADRVLPVAEAREKLTKSVHIRLITNGLEEEHLRAVREIASAHAGPCSFIIHALSADGQEFTIRAGGIKVNHDKEFLLRLRDKVGRENVWLGRDY